MSPTTRSANSTPTKAERNTNLSAGNTPTPRKAPHCTKCGKPMRGHSRKGCSTEPGEEESRVDEDIVDSFESLDISNSGLEGSVSFKRSPRKSLGQRAQVAFLENFEPEDIQVIRERRKTERVTRQTMSHAESLASLDSYSAELVDNLLRDVEDTDEEEVDEVQKKIKKERIAMPCSLFPPTPYSSFAATHPSSDVEEHKPASQVVSLGRTTSMEARQLFLDKLGDKSTVKVSTFAMPNADVAEFQQAVPKGLFTRTLPGCVGETVILVGSDEKDVEKMYQGLMKGEDTPRRRSGGMGMVAGGAIVGAVAAVAGLAYS